MGVSEKGLTEKDIEIITKLKNIFTYEPELTTLAFTTLSGHLSGELMKAINFARPDIIKRMKKAIEEKKVGDHVFVDNYCFVILRKHYNNKVSFDDFNTYIRKLPKDRKYKTTQENSLVFYGENSVLLEYDIKMRYHAVWDRKD